MYYILSYTNTNMYTFIYIYKHICSYMHTYMQMHPHPHTDIHIHLVIADLEGRSKLHDKVAATSTPQTWVGLCINTNPTCVCVCARAHTHAHTQKPCAYKTLVSLYTCVHTHVRTCTLSLSQIHYARTQTHIHANKQTRLQREIPPALTLHRTYMPTRARAHTHTHTRAHTETCIQRVGKIPPDRAMPRTTPEPERAISSDVVGCDMIFVSPGPIGDVMGRSL